VDGIRFVVGVNVALSVVLDTAPVTPLTVKLAELIVPGSIASENVAVTAAPTDTLVAPLAGVVEMTVGRVVS
jgi:hypothetical protein